MGGRVKENRKMWNIMTAQIPTSGRTCTSKGVCDLASVEMLKRVQIENIAACFLLFLPVQYFISVLS